MRVITRRRIIEFAAQHPRSEADLLKWYRVVEAATWRSPIAVKHAFSGVDPVTVASGNTVHVFNIRWNEFRLVAKFHFDKQRVYVLRIMTHREYDRQHWKDEL